MPFPSLPVKLPKRPFSKEESKEEIPSVAASISEGTRERKALRLLDHRSYEELFLARSLEDAGHWAYGVVGVELWSLDLETGTLIRPPGGTWSDVSLHPPHKTHLEFEECMECRMCLPTHPRYVRPDALAPGVGIPGVLWSEVGRAENRENSEGTDREFSIYWRSIISLAADPDQPYNARLQKAAEIGLSWAGAVPFNVEGQRGMVIYFARHSVNLVQLQAFTNEQYLIAAANYLSSVWALRVPRTAAVREREERLHKLLRRIGIKILAVVRMGMTLEDIRNGKPIQPPEKASDGQPSSLLGSLRDPLATAQKLMEEGKKAADRTAAEAKREINYVRQKAQRVLRKCRGAGLQGPPVFTWEATAWSFFGVLITMLFILRLNVHLIETYEAGDLTLGPLASFTASVYILTAAPASQPRNNLVAQTVAMFVGLCLSYIEDLDLWIREAISVSVVVALMVKFGFLHAPAAGVALTFASGSQKWSNILAQVSGNLVIIAVGSLINNLSDKRQYPTSWGFRPLVEWYRRKKRRRELKAS